MEQFCIQLKMEFHIVTGILAVPSKGSYGSTVDNHWGQKGHVTLLTE